ncbi:hypothetical protein AUC31_06925 [Planococcus rifietoensis]|uniref:DUF2357 domain-containing protein n=1 Tax=Planococcus rifietoensis TaxID=200991 RepID=A0A0U2YTQ9_9BACL|nr:hypothetical protein [Planococcus rifietoensis]ALS74974.1 hypothetical protein AUC31_06925 [Planococcus rifietoensis]
MVIHYKQQPLHITGYFENRFQKTLDIVKVWKNEEEMEISDFPIVRENSIIGLQFFVDEEHQYDDSANFNIQTNLYEQDERKMLRYKLSLGVSEKQWLYQGKDNEEFPWRMGIYFFEIYYRGVKYIGGINVLPNHLDEEQVLTIHNYLNEQVQDIIYDFVYSNKSSSHESDILLPKYWYYDYARKVADRLGEFTYSMAAINKNPSNQITTVYKPSIHPGITDKKSIVWALSNKGLSKNAGINRSAFQLNKRKTEDFESRQNQWIKNILLLLKRDVHTVSKHIIKDLNIYKDKLYSQKEAYNKALKDRDYLKNKRDSGENTIRNISSQLYMLDNDIKNTNGKVSILSNKLTNLNRMESRLSYYISNTFLDKVSRAKLKPILKNSQYYLVDSIFEELSKIRENKGTEKHLTSALKPTWQIYEYFCLFKVIKTFTDLGYLLISGIEENIGNVYFEDYIQEGTKFILENDDYVIHVWYDHYHSHSEKEAREKEELFYTPNPKKRPDLKVDYFRKTIEGEKFLTSIVLDAKFSQLKSIYNGQYRNRVTEQLVGYYHYFCVLSEAGHRPCVERVICLYAGEGNRNVQQIHESITYLRFHPEVGENGPFIIGENELKEILNPSSYE